MVRYTGKFVILEVRYIGILLYIKIYVSSLVVQTSFIFENFSSDVHFTFDQTGVLFGSASLGDLKGSPSLGESSHVTFNRMARYSRIILQILE